MSNVLLLTATIKPNAAQPGLAVSQAQERLREYARALDFYASLLGRGSIDRIVFVDNSGYDLAPLRQAHPSDRIEWLSFYGLDYPATYHRGYGEFKLVDYAMSESQTLRQLAGDDKIWKVTGRYVVRNLNRCVWAAPPRFEIYCQVKRNWAEMSVMAWSRAGYDRMLKGVYERFARDMVPELILASLFKQYRRESAQVVLSINWPPYIVGRRGSDGSSFQGRYSWIRFSLLAATKAVRLLPRMVGG